LSKACPLERKVGTRAISGVFPELSEDCRISGTHTIGGWVLAAGCWEIGTGNWQLAVETHRQKPEASRQ